MVVPGFAFDGLFACATTDFDIGFDVVALTGSERGV